MTLINQNSSVTHNGNGITTEWPYTFIIPDDASARVGLFDIATSALTEIVDTDYSITGIGDENGGEVTYPLVGSPIASTKRLVIWREVDYTQDTELTNQTPFYPTVLEDQLDRLVMQIQQVAAEAGRAIKVTLGSTLEPDEFVAELQQGAADAAASATAAAASASAASTSESNAQLAEAAAETAQAAAETAEANAESAAATAADDAVAAIDAVRYNTDQTALITAAQAGQARANIGADVLGGFRNKIINGDFDVWQRGSSQTAAGYGSDDRWNNFNAVSTKTHSRQAFTLGQTAVPGSPSYFSRTVAASTTGATNTVRKWQLIENVNTLAGKTATVTFWAKADSAKNIALELFQVFGAGGSPSAIVDGIGAQLFALTTAWQKFTVAVAIPSIAGKTLGTDGNHYLGFGFWFDAGSAFNSRAANLGHQSGTFDIARVSLVEGDATAEADPFSPRHIQQELALCQRYYWRQAPGAGKSICTLQCYSTTAAIGGTVLFPVEMRGVPTVSSFAAGEFNLLTAAAAAVGVTSMSVGYATTKSFGFGDITVGAASFTAGHATTLFYNGENAALIADAEL